ncbi:cytochrome P450 [Candidatus Obscuribacterales bacterium]|nr:cytochrome P450 [Candidatus Obscuribacterales bacterium]MBX3151032.1 cytochrome P450 [Candidatus Obscuribacterales bacterium]
MSKTSTLVDPLNPLTPEFLQDPYPTYRQLREEAPIFWSDKSKYWLITRYEDVHSILKDMSYEKQLQRWKQVNPMVKMIPEVSKLMGTRAKWMLNMNPPDHTRLRGLVNRAFTPKMVNEMRPHIQEIADYIIDRLQDKEEFDLVADFAFPLPVVVIAEMLGVPREDREQFKLWSHALTDTLEPEPNIEKMKQANKATEELYEYLRPLVSERRKNPKNDLITALAAAEEEGKKLTEDELLANCVLILVAGHETTVNLIGNAVRTLLQHQDQLDLLKANPDLIGSAIGEVLRFESPVQTTRRLAGETLELNGTKINEGDMLVLLLGAANRDPAQYENPDTFDIQRDTKKHMAYGHGIHHCLGSSLADAEAQIAVGTLFKRLPNLRLLDQKIEIRTPFALRGAKKLMVAPK